MRRSIFKLIYQPGHLRGVEESYLKEHRHACTMRFLLICLVALVIISPALAEEPGFFTRLSYLFSGNAEVLVPEDDPTGLVCDPCNAVVCGDIEEFICRDSLIDCTALYGQSCKILTCDVPSDLSCTHNGQTYQDGESFKDNCNDCTCANGNVACTLKACPECTSRLDCPTIACIRAPCPYIDCIDGACVQQPAPEETCIGPGGACQESDANCCLGLFCDTGLAPNDVRGGNFKGTCAPLE